MNILGISAYYHDSAAALIQDGEIIAAAQEERFSRKKHDARFPASAITSVLAQAGLSLADIDHVCFYDKPLIKFERLLETYLAFAPRGLRSFLTAMPVWLKEKLYLKTILKRELQTLAGDNKAPLPPLLFNEHHRSHAASAFYPSPYERAVVLCLDGVGEWATSSAWRGEGQQLTPLWEIDFPHSLGLLYSAFTYYCGFKVNSGEYKLMGLAPYGEPRYVNTILDHLLDLKDDGSFRLDMRYFNYATGLTMTNARFAALFGGPARTPESPIGQREMDLARSIQVVTEDIVLKLCHTAHRESGETNLCLAGGVALNCVANGRILREGPFESIWIQPAAGDAGGSLGAALSVWHEHLEQPRHPQPGDSMQGAFLGPAYSEQQAIEQLQALGAKWQRLDDKALIQQSADWLADGQVLGWHQGRMEFGPRALGARSILGDPRNPAMQRQMNLKIKNRESFRPFAPIIQAEAVSDWFDHQGDSPYMLIVADILEKHRLKDIDPALQGLDRLKQARSSVPAITHVDYSARLQTVDAQRNPRVHALLDAFAQQTGCPILINTSFNVRGEPVVNTPADAYRCFMRTDMDKLIIGNLALSKDQQPAWQEDSRWQQQLELD